MAALLVAAAALIGLAQHAVDTGGGPFDWPGSGWLRGRFWYAFHAENALAFALPLFVIGAAVFAAIAVRITEHASATWRVPPIRLRLPDALLFGIGSAALLWIATSLFVGYLHPTYRFIFVSAIGMLVGVLLARDVLDGRLRAKPPRLSHLLELVAVGAVVGTFVGINVRDLTNWRYSSIGDEGGFFVIAQHILQDSHVNWFSQRNGLWGDQPVLGSVWHAFNMLIFGSDVFGWKMGALTAIAITIPAFYWLLRELFGRRVATFSMIFLGASHYLFAYAHTGYNNIFALFPTVAALGCLVAGMKRASLGLLFLSGVLAGLGFYTFHSSRATVIIMGLALLTVRQRRVSLRAAAWIAPAFALTVLPLFATDRLAVIRGTAGRSVFEGNQPLLQHMAYNAIRSLFAFSFNPDHLHYTAGALLDGVTLAFAVAGLGLAIAGARNFAFRLLVIWFAVAIATTGVFSPYTTVTISRLHYALPPLAAFAGLALDSLVSALSALDRRRLIGPILTGCAIAAVAPTVFILNGRQFFIYSAENDPTTAATVIMREVVDPSCDGQPLRTIVYYADPDPALDGTFQFYNRADSRPVQLASQDLQSVYNADPRWGGTGCLILGDLRDPTLADIVTKLQAAGGDVRTITDISGQTANGLVVPLTRVEPSAAVLAGTWKTDFSQGTGLDGMIKAQEKDFLQSVDIPAAVSVDDAALDAREPVVVVSLAGITRAYPIRYVVWDGVVNDVLSGVPIAVTYDPISGTARVFDRRVDGQIATFGITGFLRGGNALLYDRETESWWQQISGRAATGALAREQLKSVDFQVVSGSVVQFAAAQSTGQIDVLAPPALKRHKLNPYLHYDVPDGKPLFTSGQIDDRFRPLQRVLVIEADGQRVAVPYPKKPTKDFSTTIQVGAKRLLLFYDARTASELDARSVSAARSIGSFAVFEAPENATFAPLRDSTALFSDETGGTWNMLGQAVGMEKTNAALTPVPHFTSFWFSASGAFPDLRIAGK